MEHIETMSLWYCWRGRTLGGCMNDVPDRGAVSILSQPAVRLLFAATLVAVLVWGSPPIGLIAGVLFALMFANPFAASSHLIAKRLLQICVVLLGFGMNLPSVLRAGANGSMFAALSIATTLLLGFWLGKRLSLNTKTTALISAGTAICGGSAIAAVGSVIAVTESEIAVAIGTVFLLNAAALYVFPIIGHALHLSQTQFGLWSGIAIHDISSVVGAAMSYGSESLETATAVKLSRTLWIVPVTLGMAMAFGQFQTKPRPAERGNIRPRTAKIAAPWFIAFFLLASLARTFVPALVNWGPWISRASHAGMTLVLFLIGASLSPRSVRALGWRAASLGIALWFFISATTLAAVTFLGFGS